MGRALGLLLLLPPPPASQEAARDVRLLVPAYFYPSDEGLREWDRLIAGASKVPIAAIVNPRSGPGRAADARYTELLARARAAGVTLVGYVATGYGKRPVEEVTADVDRWLQFYPGIRGIFFDEQSSGPDRVDHYAGLYAYARTQKKLELVVTNPGVSCDEGYVSRPAADVVCLYEHDAGFDAFRPPPWTAKYGPERFAILPYAAPTADEMRRRAAACLERRFGWIYVTDDGGKNPWDRLPAYWDELVETVRAARRKKEP